MLKFKIRTTSESADQLHRNRIDFTETDPAKQADRGEL